MSKKKRSHKRSNVPRSAKRRVSGAASAAASRRTFNPDYSHVIKDLRRIGMIAGLLILGLIVLAQFIN